jgi:hypothetical protein
MQQSPKLQDELARAREALVAMRSSKNLAELERFWKEYLGRIERVWFKLFAHYKRSPKWQAWQAPYEKMRKSDPLLSYLRNARGADEHTLADIVEHQQGQIAIVPGEQGGTIRNIKVFEDGTYTAETTGTVGVEFNSSRIRLLPVVNRGVTYAVPRHHQGLAIDSDDVLKLAEIGLNFYEQLLRDAEIFFVK